MNEERKLLYCDDDDVCISFQKDMPKIKRRILWRVYICCLGCLDDVAAIRYLVGDIR
jgi:hypothetical protein